MFHFVEPRVRRVVAEQLGIGVEELAPEVSLTDDLAADSLDLLELTLALEAEFDIQVPESALERLRTYADVLALVQGMARSRAADGPGEAAPLVWARIVPAEGRVEIERAGWLTAYTAEEIIEDALRAGRGSRLEVTLAAGTSDASLQGLQDEFAWLGERGVQVSIRRQQHGHAGHRARPHAAA